MSHQASQATAKLYKGVIDEVVNSVRDMFSDEGIDEQILQEMKQVWESKVLATKAVTTLSDQPLPPPATTASSSSASHSRSTHAQNSASSTTASSTATVVVNTIQSTSGGKSSHTNVIQPVPIASTTVPAVATVLDANAVAAGAFSQLAGHQIFPHMAAPNLTAANFAIQQSVIAANAGHGVIFPGNMRLINTAQLPTISAAHFMQVTQRGQGGSGTNGNIPQVDGPNGLSDEDEDFEDEEELQEPEEDPVDIGAVEEGDPLNSDDDVSNEDAEAMFDADNVVVCQYDKVTRTRNKWKFTLKDGVMNIDGKDYVFNKANGEAEF